MFSATPFAFSSSFKFLEELPISAVPLETASIPAPEPTNSAVTVTFGYFSINASLNAFANFSIEVEPTMLMDPLKSASALFASVAASFVVSSAFASVVCSAVVAVAAVVAAAPEFPHPASIPAAITAEPIIAITFMPFFFIIIFSSTFVPLYVCIVLRYLYFSLLFSCSYIVEYTKVLQ